MRKRVQVWAGILAVLCLVSAWSFNTVFAIALYVDFPEIPWAWEASSYAGLFLAILSGLVALRFKEQWYHLNSTAHPSKKQR